jgi:hypothetical protein
MAPALRLLLLQRKARRGHGAPSQRHNLARPATAIMLIQRKTTHAHTYRSSGPAAHTMPPLSSCAHAAATSRRSAARRPAGT